jgi:hypothetical protein
LQLRSQVEGQLIGFYRKDMGEKLLIPEELADVLEQEKVAREQVRLARQQIESEVERLKARLRSLSFRS